MRMVEAPEAIHLHLLSSFHSGAGTVGLVSTTMWATLPVNIFCNQFIVYSSFLTSLFVVSIGFSTSRD